MILMKRRIVKESKFIWVSSCQFLLVFCSVYIIECSLLEKNVKNNETINIYFLLLQNFSEVSIHHQTIDIRTNNLQFGMRTSHFYTTEPLK